MSRMRIVGGTLRGRVLSAPEGLETRPTSERVREAIFNILAHGIEGFEMEGQRVLDLFAGTGALGLEALSRGAKFAQFVDEGSEARGIIRQNADGLGLIGQSKIWRRDGTKLGPCAPLAPFPRAIRPCSPARSGCCSSIWARRTPPITGRCGAISRNSSRTGG
jgi:16S rRNA (guanine966-N2)-methyltransferase